MDETPRRSRSVVGATSLIVGPALMSIGDLFHPAESADASTQVAIVAATASQGVALANASALIRLPYS